MLCTMGTQRTLKGTSSGSLASCKPICRNLAEKLASLHIPARLDVMN